MKRGFEYALKNNGLIYGVLAQLNYKVVHPDFEDMFEEARILLAEIYTEYYRKENAKEECGSYMFQKLKWRLLDKLRQKKRKQVEVCFSQLANEDDELPQIEEIIETGDNIEISDALYQLYKRCTDNEKMLLSYYSVGITKTTEIAKLMGKSRMTINRWRKSIQEKYLELNNEK